VITGVWNFLRRGERGGRGGVYQSTVQVVRGGGGHVWSEEERVGRRTSLLLSSRAGIVRAFF